MKQFIQNVLLATLLSISFFIPQQSYAGHLFGSEMTYQCTATPNVYLVRVKVYRDCGGNQLCASCPGSVTASCAISLSLVGGASPCSGTGYGTQNINVLISQSGFDVVQLCNTQKTICTNCGTRTAGTFSPGVEVYTFEGNISLAAIASVSPTCCLVKVGYASASTRNSNITTISNPSNITFYSEVIINRCASPCNSSPVFNNPVDLVVCSGIDQNINIAAVDPDGDSLSYHLSSALSAVNTVVPYISPYTATTPFSYLGLPAQSPPYALPVGMHVDAVTGDIQFRPSGAFIAPLVVEVKQWRTISGVASLMGSTKRDYAIFSQTCPANSPVILKKYDTTNTSLGNYSFTGDSVRICAGSRFCRTFVAMDTATTDTTDLIFSANSNMPGATFTPLYNAATRATTGPRQDSVKFCWTAPLLAGGLSPYVFTVTGSDRFCSIAAKTMRSIAIYVNPLPQAIITKTQLTKNSYKFKYVKTNNVVNTSSLTQWQIETTSGSNLYTGFNSDSINNYVFPISGKYRIKLTLTNPVCGSIISLDSITVKFLTLTLVSKANVNCKGDSAGNAVFTSVGGAGTVQYKLNNSLNQNSGTFNKLLAGYYMGMVTDSFATTDSISFNITEPSTSIGITASNIVNLKCKGDSVAHATLTVSNGTAPFQYKISGSAYQSSNVLINLRGGNNTLIVSDSNNCKSSTIVNITEPANKLYGSLQLTNPVCNGGKGSANLSASGGTAPYQYRVDSGGYNIISSFGNLNAKLYTFNIKDWNGCELAFNGAVTEPSLLVVNASKNNISCFGLSDGKITVNAIGATPPYQYKKGVGNYASANVFNNLSSGNYLFVVKDSNACTASINVPITQPSALTETFSYTNALCMGANNGTASIIVSGGTLPYSYNWNTTPEQTTAFVSNLAPGLLKVTAKDSALCSISDSATISFKPLFNGEQICAVTVDTSTGKNIVIWNKTAGVGLAGYKVYGSALSAGPFSIIDSQAYNAFSSFTDNVSTSVKHSFYYYLKGVDSCGNESVASTTHRSIYSSVSVLSGSKNSLIWNNYSGVNTAIGQNILRSVNKGPFINIKQLPLTATSYIDSLRPPGVMRYLIELELSANCNPTLNKSAVIHIYSNLMDMGAVGILEQESKFNLFEIFPNPTTGFVKINSLKPGLFIATVEVRNLMGSTVIIQNANGLSQSITTELSDLSDGVYTLLIRTNTGEVIPFKVLLNKEK